MLDKLVTPVSIGWHYFLDDWGKSYLVAAAVWPLITASNAWKKGKIKDYKSFFSAVWNGIKGDFALAALGLFICIVQAVIWPQKNGLPPLRPVPSASKEASEDERPHLTPTGAEWSPPDGIPTELHVLFVNSGKKWGRILRERYVVGFGVPVVNGPKKGVIVGQYDPRDMADKSIEKDFPAGEINGYLTIPIDSDKRKHFSDGEFVQIAYEIDYCENRNNSPRCWTLHVRWDLNNTLKPNSVTEYQDFALPINLKKENQRSRENVFLDLMSRQGLPKLEH